MTDISVIIITYNSQSYIEQCLNSIYDNTSSSNFEIIVCDNNSTDNTVRIIKNKFSNVKLIENDYNCGFSKAANQCAKQAIGNYLFFLNPDTKLENNAIDILYWKAIKNNNIAAFGGKLINDENKYVFSCGYLPNVQELFLLFSNNINKIKSKYINVNEEQQIELISGADLFISKYVFNILNGFDEDYFLYYEELDLCLRLKRHNFKLLYVPNAKIIHYEKKSEEKSYLSDFYNLRSAFLYCKKHFKPNSLLLKIKFICFLFFIKDKYKNKKEFQKTLLFFLANN